MESSRRFQIEKLLPLPRAAVWHVLSHTERLNRSIGLSPVTYGDLKSEPDGFFRPASAKIAGIPMKWREYPFEWEREARHSVVRVYESGPIARFEGGIELENGEANQTLLRVFSDITPNGVAGQLLVPLIARRFLSQTLAYCDQIFAQAVLEDRPKTFPADAPAREFFPQPRAPRPKANDVNEALLKRLIDDLESRGIASGYAGELERLILEAGDDVVGGIRPFEWAHETGLNPNEALRTCLHGVKAGLLNLRWATMCPNCRVAKGEISTLSALPDSVHCDLCGIAFDLNFDRYIELKFAVHPAIRRADDRIFCLAGPFRAPHILLQKKIEVGQTKILPVPALGIRMRLRTLRTNRTLVFEESAPPIGDLLLTDGGWSDGEEALSRVSLAPDGNVKVTNVSREAIWVVIERTQWDELAATAAQVTAMQEFRALFSSEVLRPGRQIAVENVTLFFSDLSNSTALYERIGDAPAFGRVGSHFEFLSEHIGAHGGAVVKTMGDAVMAVFHRPQDALEAALKIQRHFRYFRETISNEGDVDIKIGLHRGSALAVGTGGTIDYFGRSVNIAARVAGKSHGSDIVFTRSLWDDDTTRALATQSGARLTSFSAKLRGLEEDFDLIRARV